MLAVICILSSHLGHVRQGGCLLALHEANNIATTNAEKNTLENDFIQRCLIFFYLSGEYNFQKPNKKDENSTFRNYLPWRFLFLSENYRWSKKSTRRCKWRLLKVAIAALLYQDLESNLCGSF
jgi:hypothetical protein